MKPRVAITVGDPAGIGPEVAAKAAADPRVLQVCEPVVYGPPNGSTFAPGVLSGEAGRAAHDVIVRAVSDAMDGTVQAVATAPINKEAFRLAGLTWSGHTDLLAHLTGAKRGEFDVVIACYHDQGLIPVKLLAFGQAVNVTLGLPIVRTSVDHGTAFDIAGKGVADPESMIAAVLLAARLARQS